MSTLRERNFERLRQSIAGEKSDGHAVYHFFSFPYYKKAVGVNLDEFFHNPKVMLEAQLEGLELVEKCADPYPDLGPVVETNCLGGHVVFDRQGFIAVEPAAINSVEDVLKIPTVDPYGDNYMRITLEALEYMVQNCPKDYVVQPPLLMGPFTVAAQLRGISQFCLDTVMNPDLVKAILEKVVETQIIYLKAVHKIMGDFDHVLYCDDLSAFIDPNAFNNLLAPLYKQVVADFPQTNLWLHNDANAAHIAGCLADCGFKFWQYGPQLSPTKTLEATEGKISILGGISPVALAGYSLDQTLEVCNTLMDEFAGNNRFILGAAGSVNETPPANLLAMIKLADERGLK